MSAFSLTDYRMHAGIIPYRLLINCWQGLVDHFLDTVLNKKTLQVDLYCPWFG